MQQPTHALASIAHALAFVLLLLALGGGLSAQSPRGGTLVVPLASQPQTFNPVFASDSASQLLASLTMADLMHINPRTLAVEPALAASVVHRTPRLWIVHLRPGVRFSDGQPFTAADVAFSFAVYTDPKLDAPERELLTVHGVPIRCRVLDPLTVELDLPATFAVGDRLLDSVWMLPRHLLFAPWQAGKLEQAWGLGTPPASLAGLGPFRLAGFRPGAEVDLEPNPDYWRRSPTGARLPLLGRLRLPILPDPNLRLTLLARGQVDGLESLSSDDAARLAANPCCRILDAGAGLNAEVLVLNQAPNAGPAAAWFRLPAFRQAVSLALDRANLVANVFAGKAAPLASLTSPSAGFWADPAPATARDDRAALARLAAAGFALRQGRLFDPAGHPVAFSLIVPSSNAARMRIAVFLQEDLRRVGMHVAVTPLEFNSYLDRLLHRDDYDAALVGIQIADADPNEESNVWPLGAPWHFWNPHPAPPQPWELALDRDFRAQLATADRARRLRLYRGIQAIEHTELPLIPLVAPDILVAVKPGLAGVAPGLLPPHLLWNVADLYWQRH